MPKTPEVTAAAGIRPQAAFLAAGHASVFQDIAEHCGMRMADPVRLRLLSQATGLPITDLHRICVHHDRRGGDLTLAICRAERDMAHSPLYWKPGSPMPAGSPWEEAVALAAQRATDPGWQAILAMSAAEPRILNVTSQKHPCYHGTPLADAVDAMLDGESLQASRPPGMASRFYARSREGLAYLTPSFPVAVRYAST